MSKTNMTTGNIGSKLIRYSIPLMLGNFFQLTYNAADSVIVGKFSGENALAAVGSANPIMNLTILGISGICIGASVLMSNFFGAGDYKNLKKEISITGFIGIIISALFVLGGLLFSKSLLVRLHVPEEILDLATAYLRIILLGTPFTFLYNMLSSVFRSIGDSKTPLIFLTISAGLNILMDLVLVAKFGYGVIGAAVSTVIAEAFSGIFCIVYVYRNVPYLRIKKEDFVIDRVLLWQTLESGMASALQQACQPVGKLFIQSTINTQGVAAIAAFNAVSRVDDFAFTPQQSIGTSIMTFVAQNRGAGKKERIKKGLRSGLKLEFIYWIIICSATLLFKEPLMKLFSNEGSGDMITIGVSYLNLMAFFYIFSSFTNGIQGYFRGMGKLRTTLFFTFIQISIRALFVVFLVPRMGIRGVAYASIIGWSAMILGEYPYAYFTQKKYEEAESVAKLKVG